MTFTPDQTAILALLGGVLVLLVWGRWRYDVVAFGALVAAVMIGAVPADQAFVGFGHPATVIIALVLVVSYGLAASGAVSLIASRHHGRRPLRLHAHRDHGGNRRRALGHHEQRRCPGAADADRHRRRPQGQAFREP